MATCCPHTLTGFCLPDDTPIAIIVLNGVQTKWLNLLTGVGTNGAPPVGTAACGGAIQAPLTCETDSVTVCTDNPLDVQGTVALDAPTLAALEIITCLQGTSPWIVGGEVALAAATLAALETITVLQGTIPWVTSLDAATLAALETITVNQGTSPWIVDGEVALDAATLAALETVTVNQGTSPWVIGDGGGLITVDTESGTLLNGSETAVSAVAVQVLAANGTRKKLVVQNTGTANVRVGVAGVTATSGVRLLPNGSLLLEMPHAPTQAIFAIREGATDSTVLAQEVS